MQFSNFNFCILTNVLLGRSSFI